MAPPHCASPLTNENHLMWRSMCAAFASSRMRVLLARDPDAFRRLFLEPFQLTRPNRHVCADLEGYDLVLLPRWGSPEIPQIAR